MDVMSMNAAIMATEGTHVVSIYRHKHVFLCRSNIAEDASVEERYLAYDIIIFDFGLMHRVLGTEECVANYLDGGYMRFGWCIEQTSALSIAIISLICMPKPLWLLWPGNMFEIAEVITVFVPNSVTPGCYSNHLTL
ncbi:hypothetical protein NECAME_14135 [Necator americanus]|uniref:Uncharacterized protein n=1 Tax=Necator americanus TaxID=51031 RepID=W2SPT6_NECAM|nr:hypothetical protein NECAME_14135 [Necator americanus]ETN71709.1 hypothetical protein NECAME_14135 [Necator americanus]